MRMPLFSSDRTPAVAALCLALACLSGCASKNPLVGEPAATSANSANSAIQTSGPTGVRRFLGVFSPYRVDVQQGNFVSQEMVNQLKEGMQRPEGMTREQVIFVLGTPLLTDVFHANRWDYVFRLQKKTGEVLSSRVAVFFDNNRLVRVDGGALPTEQEYLSFIADTSPGASAPANK